MASKSFNLTTVTFFFLCSIAATGFGQTAPRTVACIGDSITFGARIDDREKNCYPARLGALLGTDWAVKNFGVSGATLLKQGDKPYCGRPQFKEALGFNPDVVIIKLGTNDTKPKNWAHKEEYVSDYVELIRRFQKLGSQPTVWICYPVPAYPARYGIRDTVTKEEVLPLIDEVAEKAGVKIIDLYSALSNKKEMFPDRVHPNAAGAAKLMAETIRDAITENKGQTPTKCHSETDKDF